MNRESLLIHETKNNNFDIINTQIALDDYKLEIFNDYLYESRRQLNYY